MLTHSKPLATRLIRATAPKGPMDAVFKFCLFNIVIHLVSLTAEIAMTGQFHMPQGQRFILTVLSGGPFLWLTLYAIQRSYRLQKELIALAGTDMLTALPNRRAFVAQAQAHMSESATGCMIILDADHFKQINDSFGHATGDRCLQAIAAHLRGVVPPGDILGRIGGEEFGVCLRTMPQDMGALGRQLCRTVPVDDPDASVTVSLSGGAAEIRSGQTLETVMQLADIALYAAKQRGRSRLELWSPDTPGAGQMEAPGAQSLQGFTLTTG